MPPQTHPRAQAQSRIHIHDPPRLLTYPAPSRSILTFHASLPHYAPTPLISLPALASQLGIGHLLLKDESSRLGLPAFKILGASWAVYRALVAKLGLGPGFLDGDGEVDGGGKVERGEVIIPLELLAEAAQRANITLYAATDGNHGRAVARMSFYLGIPSKIHVPSFIDTSTKSLISSESDLVEVIVVNGDYDTTVLWTQDRAREHKSGRGVLISDTALAERDEVPGWIVDGYETMFGEVEEQVLESLGMERGRGRGVDVVVTPVGVGSLAQAAVTHFSRQNSHAAHSSQSKTKIIAVEPLAAACLQHSLEKGTMTSVSTSYTICTGMCCGTLSVSAWPVLWDGVDVAIAVEDREVHAAVGALEEYGVEAGPCGAATLAGLKRVVEEGMARGGSKFKGDEVVVLLCTEGMRGYEFQETTLCS